MFINKKKSYWKFNTARITIYIHLKWPLKELDWTRTIMSHKTPFSIRNNISFQQLPFLSQSILIIFAFMPKTHTFNNIKAFCSILERIKKFSWQPSFILIYFEKVQIKHSNNTHMTKERSFRFFLMNIHRIQSQYTNFVDNKEILL